AGRGQHALAVAQAYLFRRYPFAVCVLEGFVGDHALGEQALERLIDRRVTGLVHGASEEARIEEMQDRVLDADAILDVREPIAHESGDDRFESMQRAEEREVKGRVDVGICGLSIGGGCGVASRADAMLPGGLEPERIA